MEREFAKPLLPPESLCLFRERGSVRARLVRAGHWRGGSVGLVSDQGPLIYYRLMQTRPVVGPLAGVSEQCLAQVPDGASIEIAAIFIQQLAQDLHVAAVVLGGQMPVLAKESGDVLVALRVLSAPRGRWVVWVDGREVAGTDDDGHAGAINELARQLSVVAKQTAPHQAGRREIQVGRA